jgi:stage III sporulation protein AA
MLRRLLKEELMGKISRAVELGAVCEVRLRAGKPVTVMTAEKRHVVDYRAQKDDIDFAVGVASGFSIYAVNDTLIKGFLHFSGGIRLGITGEGVTDGETLTTVKHISSLVLRIPHEIKGSADAFFHKILSGGQIKSTLVVSPPGAGKTTLLREMARKASDAGIDTLILDERFELSGAVEGVPTMDVGANTDVVSGVPKIIAYENTIRSMNPRLIITDELFSAREVTMALDTMRAGVACFASVHAEGTAALSESEVFRPLLKAFTCIITLTGRPKPGTVKEIKVC